MRGMKRFSAIVLAGAIGLSGTAFGAGYNLAGVGAKALSMSGAFRAVADDWSAMYWNPAGLAGQQNSFFIEGKVLFPTSTVTPLPNNLIYSNKEFETKSETFPSGAIAGVFQINDRLTAGVSVFAPTAIGVTWEKTFNQIYPNDKWPVEDWKSELRVIDLHPSFGYKVTETLSFGIGLSICYADVSLQSPTFVPNPDPTTQGVIPNFYALGELEGTGFGVGVNMGLLFNINEQLSAGLSLKTPTSLNITGNLNQTAYLPTNTTMDLSPEAEAKLPLPMEIGFGLAYKLMDDRLTLAGDVQWTNWNTTGIVDITVKDGADQELPLEYEDVIRFSLGANYILKDNMQLRLGYYYDPTAIPDETLRPAITDVANKHSISLGYAIAPTDKIMIEAYWEHLFSPEREAPQYPNNENLGGTWQMSVETIGIQFGYRF